MFNIRKQINRLYLSSILSNISLTWAWVAILINLQEIRLSDSVRAENNSDFYGILHLLRHHDRPVAACRNAVQSMVVQNLIFCLLSCMHL